LPGQYIELLDPKAPDTRAAFSIASIPRAESPGRFEIAAARGSSAEFLFDLEPGAELAMAGPRGKFVYRSAPDAAATFIGAGTGLAPLRAMLLGALASVGAPPPLSPRFVVVFGGRSESDLLWADELNSLAADPSLLAYSATLSQPSAAWNGRRGYVQAHLAELLAARRDTDMYICGPDAMVRACVEVLTAGVGIASERIYTEGH
jgi:NAD(P)H-flavin reductase